MKLNFWKRLERKLFTPSFSSRKEEEIYYLEQAIRKGNARLAELQDSVKDVCPCCRYAALGGDNYEYGKLLERQERREFWLRRLKHK